MSYLGIETDTTALIDTDFSELEEATCEYLVGCSKSAEWAWHNTCGCTFLVCGPHKDEETERILDWLEYMGGSYIGDCRGCKAKILVTTVPRVERV